MPNNTPSASWKTRPNTWVIVTGLSPAAIEALPAEERTTFTTRLLAARGGRSGSARASQLAARPSGTIGVLWK